MSSAGHTVLETNLSALKSNFLFLKSKLNPNTKFLAVVKAFAYGSNPEIISKYLQDLNVDYLA